MNFEEEIKKLLKKETKLKEIPLEVPPSSDLGDFAFPCFILSKQYKKNPAEIAADLTKKIKKPDIVEDIKPTGPYLNFFLNRKKINEFVLKKILKDKANYGSFPEKKKNYMVEFFHANTHKAVHIGHIRNISLGESLSRILAFYGYNIIRANYQGDIGPHVVKCLWGYMNFKEKEPSENKGLWLANLYAKANEKTKGNEELEQEIRELTKKLYDGDKELTKLWKKTRQWCLDDFNKLYKEFNVKYDRFYFESEVEKKGKEISNQLVKKGIAKESDGAIIIDMEKENMGVFVLLRSDGVALYSAKDLALSELKQKEHKIDQSIHVVGKEQELYFKQLFKTFELMKSKMAKISHHLIYELVMLPEGKMSSREGNVIFYQDLIDNLLKLAYEEVNKRHNDISENEKKEIAKKIAFATLKFSMVSKENYRVITFDMKKALDFEGETGPYVQYAYTRIQSIIRKYGKKVKQEIDYSSLTEKNEIELINLLNNFPKTVEESANQLKPHLIARYLIHLAQKFNEFYHSCQILKEKDKLKEARIALVAATAQVLKNGLNLLGIDVMERM